MIYLIVFICNIWAQLMPLDAFVVGVQDGDTIELRMVYNGNNAKMREGKNLRIRLAHINCPEKGQPYSQLAKQFTAKACFGKNVRIIHHQEFDRYGRLIGEVVLPNGKILNQELIRNGLAVHFKKYSKSVLYADLEIEAQNKAIGIWSN